MVFKICFQTRILPYMPDAVAFCSDNKYDILHLSLSNNIRTILYFYMTYIALYVFMYTYILMVCFFGGVSWSALILVASGNLSRFRKKGRFVECCFWPWPFTLIGTLCRTCWLTRNLFDKTLLHSHLKPNYSNEACPRTSKDPVHKLLWFSQGNGLRPSKNKGGSTGKRAFSLGKSAFSPGKNAFSFFHAFQYYIHELFVSLILLERSCTIIPDTQPIKN